MLQDLNVSIAQETNSNDLDCRNLFHLKISKQDLIKIVEQASTLSDRLSQEFIAQKLEKEPKIIENRLEKWCQVVTKGDRAKFLKRLEWDSLEKDAVVLALGDVSLVNQQSLPSWTDTLQKAMEMAGAIAEDIFSDRKQERYQYLDAENPLPFEDIYLPFIEVAKQKLAKKKGCNFDLLEEKAYLQLQFGLLKQLTKLFAKTLDLEFSLFRAYQGSQLVHLISKLQDNSDQELYQEFIKNLLEDGLQTFFQEYSVLAKLAAIATDFWIESTAEFLQRLDSDWDKIGQTFSENTDLGKVSAIQTGLSDLHNRGRLVVIIKFTSDLKLVYKPVLN